MTSAELYAPGPASGARIQKDGIDVMDRFMDGNPIGRIVGAEAMKFDGWQRLHSEYAQQFGVESPGSQFHTPKS